MCTPGEAAATTTGIRTIGDGHSENCEGPVGRLGRGYWLFCLLLCRHMYTYIADKQSVEGMAPKLQPEEAPKQPTEQAARGAAAQAAEAAQEEAPKAAAEAALATKEAKPQALKEATKRPAEAGATKEAKPQAPKEVAKHPAEATETKEAKPQVPKEAATQPAEAAATKEAKPQAPKEAAKQPAKQPAQAAPTKEAKPQAPREAKAAPKAKKKAGQQPAEEWLQSRGFIPGWGPDSDDSSSARHGAELSESEIAELTDVERDAYKEAGPPPPTGNGWNVPRKCGIAPVGRSWQDRAWRARYKKKYRTSATETAGKVTKEGQPVNFPVTTTRDRTTEENTPMAYY